MVCGVAGLRARVPRALTPSGERSSRASVGCTTMRSDSTVSFPLDQRRSVHHHVPSVAFPDPRAPLLTTRRAVARSRHLVKVERMHFVFIHLVAILRRLLKYTLATHPWSMTTHGMSLPCNEELQ